MTRINCIPVEKLLDQHLFAEYREITRISKLAKKLYGKNAVPSYRMSTGHVKFFYNKGLFLLKRTQELYNELIKRNYNVQYKEYQTHPDGLNNDWTPTLKAQHINLERLNSKLKEKENGFYRYYNEPAKSNHYDEVLNGL